MKSIAIVHLLLFASVVAANAAQGDGLSTREGRLRWADEILAEMQALNDTIPNLTPEEEKWRQKEDDRIKRLDLNSKAQAVNLTRFWSSREYRIWRAKAGLSSLINGLRGVSNVKSGEMFLWSVVAVELIDSTTFECVRTLEEDRYIKLPEPEFFSGKQNLYANWILTGIIQPHLARAEGTDIRMKDGKVESVTLAPPTKKAPAEEKQK